jgi:hypothetical protein
LKHPPPLRYNTSNNNIIIINNNIIIINNNNNTSSSSNNNNNNTFGSDFRKKTKLIKKHFTSNQIHFLFFFFNFSLPELFLPPSIHPFPSFPSRALHAHTHSHSNLQPTSYPLRFPEKNRMRGGGKQFSSFSSRPFFRLCPKKEKTPSPLLPTSSPLRTTLFFFFFFLLFHLSLQKNKSETCNKKENLPYLGCVTIFSGKEKKTKNENF